MAPRVTARPPFVFPLFLAGSIILSAGPLFVRLADVGAVQSAFWRLALAAPFLFLLVRLTERRIAAPRGAAMGWLLLGGLFFASDLAAWHFGITLTTLANSTLFGNAAAFLLPVWGYAMIRRWPTRTATVALALAASGIIVLAGRSASISPDHLAGDLLCLLAAVFYTGYLIVMARARQGLSALAALASATLAGAILLLPAALLSGGALLPQDWTPLILLALGSQVLGQGLIIYGLPHLPPVASGIGLLVQPLFSASLGFLWFGELLGLPDAAGMAMILAAILLVRRPSAAEPAVEKRVPPLPGGAALPKD